MKKFKSITMVLLSLFSTVASAAVGLDGIPENHAVSQNLATFQGTLTFESGDRITSITSSGVGISHTCSIATQAAPGSCTVTFTPTSQNGQVSAKLVINTNKGRVQKNILLSYASSAIAELNLPESINLGSVSYPAALTKEIEIKNIGSLSTTSLITNLTGAGVKFRTNLCNRILQPNQSCKMTVQYNSPNEVSGQKEAQLKILQGSNELASAELLINLSNSTKDAEPVPSPIAELDIFIPESSDVPVGATENVIATVKNIGAEATLSKPTFNIAGTGWSIRSNLCLSVLQPNASCQITLTFKSQGLIPEHYPVTLSSGSFSTSSVASIEGAPINHLLTLSKIGNGSVSSSPAGITCGSSCVASYLQGSVVTLTATPAIDQNIQWGGDCSLAEGNSCVLALNSPKTVSIEFVELIRHNLTIVSNSGVSANPVGESCGPNCSRFVENTFVTITAEALLQNQYRVWSGECATNFIGDTCTVQISADKTITVNTFNKAQFNLAVGITNGSITGGPVDGSFHNLGTVFGLTAVPSSGSHFVAWTGDCSSSLSETCALTMNESKTVGAAFELNTYLATYTEPTLEACDGIAAANIQTCREAWGSNTVVTNSFCPSTVNRDSPAGDKTISIANGTKLVNCPAASTVQTTVSISCDQGFGEVAGGCHDIPVLTLVTRPEMVTVVSPAARNSWGPADVHTTTVTAGSALAVSVGTGSNTTPAGGVLPTGTGTTPSVIGNTSVNTASATDIVISGTSSKTVNTCEILGITLTQPCTISAQVQIYKSILKSALSVSDDFLTVRLNSIFDYPVKLIKYENKRYDNFSFLNDDPGAEKIVFNNELYLNLRERNGQSPILMRVTSSGALVSSTLLGRTSDLTSNPANFVIFNNELYFTALNSSNVQKMFKVRADQSSKQMTNIKAAGTSDNITKPMVAGNSLYFSAASSTTAAASKLHRMDSNGVVTQISNINAAATSDAISLFAELSGELYFVAGTSKLYRAYGTGSIASIGTTTVTISVPPVIFNNELHFVGTNSSGLPKILKVNSDYTLTSVVNIRGNTVSDAPANLTVMGDSLFFTAQNSGGFVKLFKLKGGILTQVSNTRNANSDNPTRLIAVNDELFFTSANAQGVYKLYKINSAGTVVQVSNIRGDSLADAQNVFAPFTWNNELYINLLTGAGGGVLKLFKVNNDGVLRQISMNSGDTTTNDNAQGFAAFNGKLYYSGLYNNFSYVNTKMIEFSRKSINSAPIAGNVPLDSGFINRNPLVNSTDADGDKLEFVPGTYTATNGMSVVVDSAGIATAASNIMNLGNCQLGTVSLPLRDGLGLTAENPVVWSLSMAATAFCN